MGDVADIQAVLTARFIAAIRKSFNPCPLLSPKWFKYYPNGKPADFQFTGLYKLAKATTRPQALITQMIIKNLDLKGVEADVRSTTKRDAINVCLKKPQA